MEIVDKKRRYIYYWLILYCFASVTFFSPVMISSGLLKGVSWAILAATFIYTAKEIFFSPIVFSRYGTVMRYVAFMLLITIPSSIIIHSQGFVLSARSVLEVILFTFFFFLKKEDVSLKDIEKVVIIMTIIYVVLYMVALAVAPRILFDPTGGSIEGVDTTRGIARIKIEGMCFVHLSLFMYINKWNVERKKKYLYIAGLLFLMIMLKVSRQHIVFAGALGFLMITSNVKFVYKVPIALLIGFLVNYIMNNVGFVQKLINLSEKQISDTSQENIRVRAFRFFMTEYNDTVYQDIFGNGIPHSNSAWGIKFNYMKQSLGYVPSDVGYGKVFFYFGALGLILFFIVAAKILIQKLPKEVLYCKYYMLFLLGTNIASHSFFTDTITFVFIIYVADYAYRKQVFKQIENSALKVAT